jgi:putative ABC transport system ATP-binding protein
MTQATPANMHDASPALRIRALRLAVGPGASRPLLNIGQWQLPGGTIVVLRGPSGSGKTTLLHHFAGLMPLEPDTVLWGNTDLALLVARQRDAWRRDALGMVFQQFHLLLAMSALENVLTPLRLDQWHCTAAQLQRARDLLGELGVAPQVAAGRLSRGEQQRVALARALIRGPHIVLADEPSASLDQETAVRALDVLVRACRERRVTTIIATHDAAAVALADEVFDLRDGALVRHAPQTRP